MALPPAPPLNPTAAAAPPASRQQRAAAYAARTDEVAASAAAAGGEEEEGWDAEEGALLEDLRELDTPAPKVARVTGKRKKRREVAAPEVESANAKALRLFFASDVMEAAADAAAQFLSPLPALSAKGRAKKVTSVTKRGFQVCSLLTRTTPAPRPHALPQTAFQAAVAFLRVRMVTTGTLSTRCAPTQKLRLSGSFDPREHSVREVVHHLAGGIRVYVKGTETCMLVQCSPEQDAQLVRAACKL